jgi:hypothetical protein
MFLNNKYNHLILPFILITILNNNFNSILSQKTTTTATTTTTTQVEVEENDSIFDIISNENNQIFTTTKTTTQQESYLEIFDPKFPRWLTIFIFVVGIFGNSLSLAVFRQDNMKKHSTFVYLSFLSIVDILVLIFGLGDVIIVTYLKVIL